MVAPINYAMDVQSPIQAAMQGFQLGSAGLEAQAKRQAIDAQSQINSEVTNFINNPTRDGVMRIAGMIPPEKSKPLIDAFNARDEAGKQEELSFIGNTVAALNNNPKTAIDLLQKRADIERKNGRDGQAKVYEDAVTAINNGHGDLVGHTMTLVAAGLPGGEKLVESYVKMQQDRRAQEMQAPNVSEAQAKAYSAATAAKFAESKAISDLTNQGWQTNKLMADTDFTRQNTKIAALSADLNKAKDQATIDKINSEIEKTNRERDEKVGEKAASINSARLSMDNLLTSLQKVIEAPEDVRAAASGTIDRWMPTGQNDVAAFEENLNTINSQIAIGQLESMQKSLAPMSDTDVKLLISSLQNLTLRGGGGRGEVLVANAKKAQDILKQARSNLAIKYGVPDTSPNIEKNAENTAKDINAAMQKHPPSGM